LLFEGRLPAPGTVVGKVTGLYIYPVKSGQAVSLDHAGLDECGMAGDRRLMVISKKGTKVTQLVCPKLATLKATFPDDEHVLLRGPNQSELKVSLRPSHTAPSHDVMVIVTSCKCVDLGDLAAAFIDALTGRKGDRLVMQVDGSYRYIKDLPLWFGESPSTQDKTSLQDFGPLLLTNETSLAQLNTKIEPSHRSGMDRFRANIVITTTHPHHAWIEDHFKTIKIGRTVFNWMAPCIRCLQPCIDQTTGQANYLKGSIRDAQPTHALRDHHPGSLKRSFLGLQSIPKGGAGGLAPAFGVLLTHSHQPNDSSTQHSFGELAVGDDVSVVEYLQPTFLQRIFGF